MKKLICFVLMFAAVMLPAAPVMARDHGHGHGGGHFRFFFGLNCCGYYGYPYYYPYYYAYAPPPPVIYAPPVVYAQPQTVIMPAESAPAISADQASPTFIDDQGRTCREYQTTTRSGGSAHGTACLQPDGSWRVVR